MDNTYYTTEHRKGQHLFSEERHEIEVRLKDGWTINRIAKHIGRPYNTIKNEIARGTVELYGGKVKRYKADEGEKYIARTEFANLPLLEDDNLKVCFTHPYSSFEKGTVECHNRMLRRFIPKGKSIADYTDEQICFFADCINGLPRKILSYRSPTELFDAQLDALYAV